MGQALEPPPGSDVPKERRSGLLRFVLDILETLFLAAVLFAVINFISARIQVDGTSMEPTLHTGEYILVDKLAYKFGSPAYRDVIVFHPPSDLKQDYIKRIIGLPNDRVRVSSGQVYVNERLQEESYIAAAPAYKVEMNVPPGSVFVLGDNRNNSQDSHNWGPVPITNIIGKARLVYWPPRLWGWIGEDRLPGVSQ